MSAQGVEFEDDAGTDDDVDGDGGISTGEDVRSGVEEARSISKDDAFHVLQNARRRAVLRYIFAHPEEEQFVMRDIAEEVAAWENDTTVQQLVSSQRQRVYIALYQSHLPKLDEHGVIEYNQSRGVVETTPLTPVFEPYLEDGLHAERDLTVDDGASPTEGSGSDGGLTRAITSFLDG